MSHSNRGPFSSRAPAAVFGSGGRPDSCSRGESSINADLSGSRVNEGPDVLDWDCLRKAWSLGRE